MPSSASLSKGVHERLKTNSIRSKTSPISSVWRFGRDFRHSTNGDEVSSFHGKCTLMNLERTQLNQSQHRDEEGDRSTSR